MSAPIWEETTGLRLFGSEIVAALPAPWHDNTGRDDREYGVTRHTVAGDEEDFYLYEVGHLNMGADAVYARAVDAAAHFRSVTEGYGYPGPVVSAALFALVWGHAGNDREVRDLTGYATGERSGG